MGSQPSKDSRTGRNSSALENGFEGRATTPKDNSKQITKVVEPSKRRASITKTSELDLNNRMDATTENKVVIHDNMKITYAWVAQRGYYPDGNN